MAAFDQTAGEFFGERLKATVAGRNAARPNQCDPDWSASLR